MVAGTGTGEIRRVARVEKVVDESISTAIGLNAGGGIATCGTGREHVIRTAGVNADAVVVAGVVGDHVVVSAGDVDACGITVAGIVGNSSPGAGKPDSRQVIVAIVVHDDGLRGVLDADTRVCRASRTIAT